MAFLLFLFLAVLSGQAYPPGPQVLTFWSTADNSDQPYGIDTSDHFRSVEKYSLLIMLRGAYSSERLELCRVFGQPRTNRTPGVALFSDAARRITLWPAVCARDLGYIAQKDVL